MKDPRHAKAMDVFMRACDLTDESRDAFIAQACGDDETLRAEVTSLLKHHQSGTILAEARRLDVQTRMLEEQKRPRTSGTIWKRELGRMPPSFWLSVFLGIFVLLLAIWTRGQIHNSLETSLQQDLTTVLEADVQALEHWVARQQLEVVSWAEHVEVSRLTIALKEISESEDSTRKEALLQAHASRDLLQLLEPVHGLPGILGVIVFSLDGIVLMHTMDSMVGEHVTDAADPYIARILSGETVLVRPTKLAGFDQSALGPVMAVATPIRDQIKRIIGGLAFVFPSDDEYTQILSVAQLGETGETYAFDKDYTLLSNPRDPELLVSKGWLQKGAEVALAVRIRVPNGNQPPSTADPPTWIVEKAVSGRQGFHVNLAGYSNYLGNRVVGVSKWLDDLDFGVCTEISYEEAFAPVRYVDRFSAILLGLNFLFAAVTAAYTFLNVRLRHAVGVARQLGSYTLLKLIGQGGMGKVYQAEHALLRRPTAVKLLEGQSADQDTVTRFEREVDETSQLTHPNTIQIYDYGRTDDDVFYFAMEYLLGPNFLQLVELAGPLPPARVAHILLQACGSLKEAHDRGLIHRDVKPANMILCKRGGLCDVVKVLDFGLVKSFRNHDPDLTRMGTIGTPAYIAPERLSGQTVDHRSDIFSLGAVAYFLLTGQVAFRADTPQLTLEQVLHAEPSPPSQLVDGDIPAALEELVMRCMAKAAQDRPPDVASVISELLVITEVTPWRQEDARRWWEAYEIRTISEVLGKDPRIEDHDPAS